MKFSIIIPVYNVAEYLGECLDSIVAQKIEDWEGICVDDGSTDRSGEILDAYAQQDSRFRVVHQVNRGVSAARNAALDIANGDWICFIDSDDMWSPWLLKTCLDAVEKNPDVDMIRFKYHNFKDPTSNVWGRENGSAPVAIDLTEFVEKVGNDACLWTQIYRRELIVGLRFPGCAYYEDMVFVYGALDRCEKLLEIDRRLYGYRIRPGSAMRSRANERWLSAMLAAPLAVLELMADSKKRYPKSAVRQNCNKMTEEFYVQLCGYGGNRKLRQMWMAKWRDALKRALCNQAVGGFQRARMMCLAAMPIPIVAWLLCKLPNKIKRIGLHR